MLTLVGSQHFGSPSDWFSVAGPATQGDPADGPEPGERGSSLWRDSGNSLGPDGLAGPTLAKGEHAGDRIGPYTLLSVIAEGGFGVVWLAERLQPFHQRVAIKIVKAGMDSRQVLSRFERERQTLAILEHPGIARVIDGGLTALGRPYFVMEYVSGSSVTEFCDHYRLGLRTRLALFAQICRVVHAAHVKGVIHRDLKPANILVEGDAERARPRIIDFGMARVVSQQSELFAQSEQVVLAGTLEYMSPEQARLEAGIDTRADVYALGVILHEILTSELPLASSMLRSIPLDQARSLLAGAGASRPSDKLALMPPERAARVALHRATTVRELTDRLRRELDLIVSMATRPERDRRYQSALAFAEDIERYLSGRALIAAPDSSVYRLTKLVRRNRILFGSAAGVVIALVGGLVGTSIALKVAIRAKADADASREVTKQALDRVRATLYASNLSIASGELQVGRPAAAVARLERCEPDQRPNWEWKLLRTQSDSSIATIGDFMQQSSVLVISPGGELMFRGGTLGEAHVLDPISGAVLAELQTAGVRIVSAAFSGCGRFLAVSGGQGFLRLYRLLDDQGACDPRVLATSAEKPGDTLVYRDLLFSTDGQRLFAGGSGGALVMFSVPDLAELRRFPVEPSPIRMTALLAGGQRLYALNSKGTLARFATDTTGEFAPAPDVKLSIPASMAVADSSSERVLVAGSSGVSLWDPDVGEIPIFKGRLLFRHIAIAPGGKHIAMAGQDRVVRFAMVQDLATGHALASTDSSQTVEKYLQRDELSGTPTAISFSHDGSLVAVSSDDGLIRLYSVPEFRLAGTLPGHAGSVGQLAFVPATQLLVSSGDERRLKLWTTSIQSPELLQANSNRRPTTLEFADPGRLLVGYGNGEIETWDGALRRRVSTDAAHTAEVAAIAAGPDGTLITAARGGDVSLWRGLSALLDSKPAFSGQSIATNFRVGIDQSGDGAAVLDDATIGRFSFRDNVIDQLPSLRLPPGFGARMSPVFVGSGSELAVVARLAQPDGAVRVRYADVVTFIDRQSGQERGRTRGFDAEILAMVASPDGRQLAIAYKDTTVRLWDVASRSLLLTLRGSARPTRAMVWLNRSNRLITGGEDSSIRVWDPVIGEEICVASTVSGTVTQLVASPDERLLAVLTLSGVRLLDSNPVPLRLAEQLQKDSSLQSAIGTVLNASGKDWLTPSRLALAELTSDPATLGRLALVRALHAGGWFGGPVIAEHTVSASEALMPSRVPTANPGVRARPFEKPSPPQGTDPDAL